MIIQRCYQAILNLYPPEFVRSFGPEIISVFRAASADLQNRRAFRRLWFAARELLGLLTGLWSEHVSKWAAPEAYLNSCAESASYADLPVEIAELRRHVDHLVRCIESAIAHHDFPKARKYSMEERVARQQLETLLSDYHLNRPTCLLPSPRV